LAIAQGVSTENGGDLMKERVSVGTNAFEWLITVPNVKLEYDLLPGEFNNKSLVASLKYNWNTWHQQPTYYVFNALNMRVEYRYHYRCRSLKEGETFNWKSLSSWTSLGRPNPRTWLAHYIGPYVDFSTFSIKMSPTGRQGWQAGLGVSAGVEFPLYQYKDRAIDMDLGAAAGLSVSKYDFYTLSKGASSYMTTGKDAKVMILPVLAEIRAAFTLRKVSVRERYKSVDPEIPRYNLALQDIDFVFNNVNQEIFVSYLDKAHLQELLNDKEAYQKEYIEWVNEAADGLRQNTIDPLPVNAKRKAKLLRIIQQKQKKAISAFSFTPPSSEKEETEE